MSSSGSSVIGKNIKEILEPYDEDVIVLEKGDCAARLRGFLLRLAVSIIVIGACAGALAWSFQINESAVVIPTHDPSVDFTINVTQYTKKNGNYSITYREPDSENNNNLGKPSVFPSFWIQDNVGKRLVHQRDNQTIGFFFESYAFWATYDKYNHLVGCCYDHTLSYDLYLSRLGLTRLIREHSAYESTKNHQKVYIYNGDPSDVLMEGTPQNAFLVTVFADSRNGALLGWDTYFTSSNSSLVYEISYWYDSMTLGLANSTYFDPPSECQPVVQDKCT